MPNRPVYRKSSRIVPALHRAYTAAQVTGDFFPPIENGHCKGNSRANFPGNQAGQRLRRRSVAAFGTLELGTKTHFARYLNENPRQLRRIGLTTLMVSRDISIILPRLGRVPWRGAATIGLLSARCVAMTG